MQFQVPQFIEIEDKIFGPLTLKQFIYLAGGAGISVVIWRVIPYFIIYVPLIVIVMIFSISLAFYKVHGRPFIAVVESAFNYSLNNKLYIWKKAEKKMVKKEDDIKKGLAGLNVPKLSESKLKDLTWSLDINETLGPTNNQEKRG